MNKKKCFTNLFLNKCLTKLIYSQICSLIFLNQGLIKVVKLYIVKYQMDQKLFKIFLFFLGLEIRYIRNPLLISQQVMSHHNMIGNTGSKFHAVFHQVNYCFSRIFRAWFSAVVSLSKWSLLSLPPSPMLGNQVKCS